jgi:hypothetical protein
MTEEEGGAAEGRSITQQFIGVYQQLSVFIGG